VTVAAKPGQFTADVMGSGVARVPCALGQEIFLRSLPTNSTEFEVKNRCKSVEEKSRKFTVVILIILVF